MGAGLWVKVWEWSGEIRGLESWGLGRAGGGGRPRPWKAAGLSGWGRKGQGGAYSIPLRRPQEVTLFQCRGSHPQWRGLLDGRGPACLFVLPFSPL